MLLPELPESDLRYLTHLYRKNIHGPQDIKASYLNGERWILEYVEPKWLLPGNIPDALVSAAILYVHKTWANSIKDSNAARYCMHALIGPYTKANQAKLG